jgi:hypothetical protein
MGVEASGAPVGRKLVECWELRVSMDFRRPSADGLPSAVRHGLSQ